MNRIPLPRPSQVTRCLAILLLVTVIAASVFDAEVIEAQTTSATLMPVSGLIQVLRPSTDAWSNVTDMQMVTEGDQIRTGANGLARLTSVSGVSVDILPSTHMHLKHLLTNPNSPQWYSASQVVGASYAKVKTVTNRVDRVRMVMPAGVIEVKGTAFVQYTGLDAVQAIFGEEGRVQYTNAKGQRFQVGANTILVSYLPGGYAGNTTLQSLSNAKVTVISEPINAAELDALKVLLMSLTVQYDNASGVAAITSLLGIPATSSRQAILVAIDGLTVPQVDVPRFNASLIAFFSRNYPFALGTTVAQSTCGNKLIDAGENIGTCPDDVLVASEFSSCGDLICQQDRGESVVSCPADCFPNAPIAETNIDLVDQNVAPLPTQNAPPSGDVPVGNNGNGNGNGNRPTAVPGAPIFPTQIATIDAGVTPPGDDKDKDKDKDKEEKEKKEKEEKEEKEDKDKDKDKKDK